MHIEFTARDGNSSRDFVLRTDAGTPVETVRDRLVEHGVGTAGDPVWHGDRLLPVGVSVGAAGLRSGAVVGIGAPALRSPERAPVSLDVVGGPAAGGQHGLLAGRVAIGRSPHCEVPVDDADVSRVHAVLDVTDADLLLSDANSTNGTTVEGSRVHASAAVSPGQVVRIGDTFLTVRRADEAPATVRSYAGVVAVNRAPRQHRAPPRREIALPQPPRAGMPHRVQLIAALVPAVAGVGFAWFLHAAQFLFFALLSPVVLLASALGDRLHWRRSTRREAAGYRRRLDAARAEVRTALTEETARRRAAILDPVAVAATAAMPGSRLWERRLTDGDALDVRMGLADLPSQLRVTGADPSGGTSAGTCHAVPLAVSLRSGPLGLAGPARPVRASARWLVTQLCVAHAPTDLDLVLVSDAETARLWHWARWLPHLRGRAATTDAERGAAIAELSALLATRRATRRAAAWVGPWTVVIVDARQHDVPGLAQLLAEATDAGVSAVWLATDTGALPQCCRSVATISSDSGTRVSLSTEGGAAVEAVLDQVAPTWAEEAARALAPLVDGGTGTSGGIPDRCSLVDLLEGRVSDADAVVAAWDRSDDGAATVLGQGPDGPLVLDLVRDGPHALIAGTTGSGKSELLRTLVVGLAAAQPPEKMAFLLIDYKGGAAFADCARLPHTAGLVTDLDPHLTRRALQSLDAELLRRERLFSEAQVADLAAYRAVALDAMPRLVIVVDEFAALAEELPEFVRGLVAIAQRGRSLGVHVVLATQRPGSVVSPEIRANASVRISLRVTSAAESADVIDAPAAAAISQRTPGRAYARLADSLMEFQAAGVGLDADKPADGQVVLDELDEWCREASPGTCGERTQLAALVDLMGAAAKRHGASANTSPWCAPLPTTLPVASLTAPDAGSVPLGLVDLPHRQCQEMLSFDLHGSSSLLVVGGARAGRTTGLATLALGAASTLPAVQLHLYVIDAGGGASALKALPHCSTYVEAGATARAARLIERLGDELDRRRHRTDAPVALLLVDGWEQLAAGSDDYDAGRCADALLRLARSGPGCGIFVALSGDRAALSPRVAPAFGQRIILALNDRADFGLAGIPPRTVPQQLPPGRGLRATDAAEVHLAFHGPSPDENGLQAAVRTLAAQAHPREAASHPPIRIRELPASLRSDQLVRVPGRCALGLGGDDAHPVNIDLASTPSTLLIAGPPRSGRTTALRTLLAQLPPTDVLVVAPARSALNSDARSRGVPVLNPGDPAPPAPAAPTVVLVDDADTIQDEALGEVVVTWMRAPGSLVTVVATGRSDEVATAYRGLLSEVRRQRCGLLLQPGPVDGEILGVRLPRVRRVDPPGRGVLVADPAWRLDDADGPIPIQVALP